MMMKGIFVRASDPIDLQIQNDHTITKLDQSVLLATKYNMETTEVFVMHLHGSIFKFQLYCTALH